MDNEVLSRTVLYGSAVNRRDQHQSCDDGVVELHIEDDWEVNRMKMIFKMWIRVFRLEKYCAQCCRRETVKVIKCQILRIQVSFIVGSKAGGLR